MSETSDSFDFKVIKRIPLSKSISSKINLEDANIKSDNKSKNYRLEKINLDEDINKIDTKISSVNLDFKSIKKTDFKPILIDDDLKDKSLVEGKIQNNSKSKDSFKVSSFEVVENKLIDISKENILSKEKETFTDKSSLKDNLNLNEDYKGEDDKAVLNEDEKAEDDKAVLNEDDKAEDYKAVLNEDDKGEDYKAVLNEDDKVYLNDSIAPKVIVNDSILHKDIIFNDFNDNNSKKRLEGILNSIHNPIDEKQNQDDFFEKIDRKSENIDSLLDQLNKKTNQLDEDIFLESFSFLDNAPKVKKIKYPSYNIKNLYSKIDSLNNKSSNQVKESNLKSNLSNKQSDLNKPTSVRIKPTSNSSKNIKSLAILEEIEIPDIFAIEDNVKDLNHIVEDKYSKEDLDESLEINQLNDDSKMVSVVKTNEAIEKIPNFVIDDKGVFLNSEIEKRMPLKKIKNENFNITEFNDKINSDEVDLKHKLSNLNLTKDDDQRIYNTIKNIKSPITITEKVFVKTKEKPKVKKDLIDDKFKDLKDKGIDYILPKNAGMDSIKINREIYKEDFKTDDGTFSSLVYSDSIIPFSKDITKVYDKYSIDEFTYVTIYYDGELFYNLIQPELNSEQEKEFLQIKKIFFNTIDKDYYSFNGNQESLNNYIEKIYSISVDKLSYNLNNLQKKLYLKFILREFFGLGILTNLLKDKKIIEVSCSGEKSNILVNHVDYGVLKTNISFESISQLNNFVLILTKNMGLYVNQSHPIIEGYLPNGYKVEGLYSVGDTSSKGSSFIIKKYLDEPLTPITLINTSVGSIDVFTYIWSAISEDYKVIIVDDDNSFVIFNSLLLFYPNKKIITVQSYDRLKLPQKEWINRVFTTNQDLNKKLIVEQTISQKPDYIVLDEFTNEIFEVSWYNVDLFSIKPDILPKVVEQLKAINQKSIVIELKKIKQGIKEVLQIINIKEIINKKENLVIDIDLKENSYVLNLLISAINVVDFLKRKKIMRWMKDSKIYNYKDFNSITSEFYFEKQNLLDRLDIK